VKNNNSILHYCEELGKLLSLIKNKNLLIKEKLPKLVILLDWQA